MVDRKLRKQPIKDRPQPDRTIIMRINLDELPVGLNVSDPDDAPDYMVAEDLPHPPLQALAAAILGVYRDFGSPDRGVPGCQQFYVSEINVAALNVPCLVGEEVVPGNRAGQEYAIQFRPLTPDDFGPNILEAEQLNQTVVYETPDPYAPQTQPNQQEEPTQPED